MINFADLPPVVFTQEQREAYAEHQNYIDKDGIVQWGKCKGQHFDQINDVDYLRALMVRYIANVILLDKRVSGADPDVLRRLIAANPQFEERFRRHFEYKYGITIPDEELGE